MDRLATSRCATGRREIAHRRRRCAHKLKAVVAATAVTDRRRRRRQLPGWRATAGTPPHRPSHTTGTKAHIHICNTKVTMRRGTARQAYATAAPRPKASWEAAERCVDEAEEPLRCLLAYARDAAGRATKMLMEASGAMAIGDMAAPPEAQHQVMESSRILTQHVPAAQMQMNAFTHRERPTRKRGRTFSLAKYCHGFMMWGHAAKHSLRWVMAGRSPLPDSWRRRDKMLQTEEI